MQKIINESLLEMRKNIRENIKLLSCSHGLGKTEGKLMSAVTLICHAD